MSSRNNVTDFMRSPNNINGGRVEIVNAVNGARYVATSDNESWVRS